MKAEFKFRIVLEDPPPGVDFGLQKGRGSSFETIQKQRSGSKDLCFEFQIGINRDNHLLPDYFGPLVQGPQGGRFLYIDIGAYAGQANTGWARRLKIPLIGITREMLNTISADPQTILETRIPGTGKDGGPTCGTVKPFQGWKVATVKRS